MADSRSLVGGMVAAVIWASWVSLQLSFEARLAPLLSCNSRVGSASAPATPAAGLDKAAGADVGRLGSGRRIEISGCDEADTGTSVFPVR